MNERKKAIDAAREVFAEYKQQGVRFHEIENAGRPHSEVFIEGFIYGSQYAGELGKWIDKADGIASAVIRERFGISNSCIGNIKRGERYLIHP